MTAKNWPISEPTVTGSLPHDPEGDARLRAAFAERFAGLPRERRQLKVHVTVTTDLPEHRVRELANRYAELLAEAVGSEPVKANVTPLGSRAQT